MSQLAKTKKEEFFNANSLAVRQTTDKCNATKLNLDLPLLKGLRYDKPSYRPDIHLFCL